MMTALSQAEDKMRADKLGADRYLVKSQVTLEDVAKVAREVLEGSGAPPPNPSSETPSAPPTVTPIAVVKPADPPADDKKDDPKDDTPTPPPAAAVVAPTKILITEAPPAVPLAPQSPVVQAPIPQVPVAVPVQVQPPVEQTPAVQAPEPVVQVPAVQAPVVQTTIPSTTVSQFAAAPSVTPSNPPLSALSAVDPTLTQTTANEEATVHQQIKEFIAGNPTITTSADPDHPNNAIDSAVVAPTEPTPVAVPVNTSEDEQPKPVITRAPAAAPQPTQKANNITNDTVQIANKKVINPISDIKLGKLGGPDLNKLLAEEEKREAASQVIANAQANVAQSNSIVAPGAEISGNHTLAAKPSTAFDDPNNIAL